jgi:hypothetical protein
MHHEQRERHGWASGAHQGRTGSPVRVICGASTTGAYVWWAVRGRNGTWATYKVLEMHERRDQQVRRRQDVD